MRRSIEVGYSRSEKGGRRKGGCRRLRSRLSTIGDVARGPTRMTGRMLEAPSPPSQSAAQGRAPLMRCSASSRGWCATPMGRVSGCVSSPSGCWSGRGQSRRPATGKTCPLLLSAWRGSSREEGCSGTGSSRSSSARTARSSRSRPGGRIQSSRWRRRFACRNPGRTGAPSRKTWRLVEWTRGRIGAKGC